MKIHFHKSFEKAYGKLNKKIQQKIDMAIFKFKENPFDESLNNHVLRGNLVDRRAISVTGDMRIIFQEFSGYVFVIIFDVGTHSQVY